MLRSLNSRSEVIASSGIFPSWHGNGEGAAGAGWGRIAVRMVDNDDSPAPSRGRHFVRLVVFAAFVLGLFYQVAVLRVIDVEEARRVVAATGPAAPLAY